MPDPTETAMTQAEALARRFSLEDRLVLITGSTSGIGFALAAGLAAAGARIILNGRSPDRADQARAALAATGATVGVSVFDVTNGDMVREAVAQIEATHGAIDVLINNAGIQHRAPLHEFPEAAFRQVIDTNLVSAFLVGQAVARGMIARRRGSIINICSVQSELARPGIAPYSASKGGLKMLTKGMALDWGPYGIRANGIAPGYFRTELDSALVEDSDFSNWLVGRTPLRRWGEVDELVGAAVFLASDAASFVTGHVLFVDGGVTSCL